MSLLDDTNTLNLDKIESDIKKQIKDVEKFSLESPLPELEELFTEVYL